MNKYLTIYITILITLGAAYADINDQLVAHYPFAGDFNDVTGNHAPAVNSGTTWTTDKNGNSNSALSFTENPQYVEIPVSSLNGLVDYSLCFWAKSKDITDIARSFVSLSNNQG